MKTLDEVIKACEETVNDVDRGVDIEGCFLGATETRDALHYLREYRENKSGLEKTKEALEVKKKIYEDMTEKIMQQGQENEARCQAEITRYLEAVKNCKEAENKYKKLADEATDDLTALRAYWAEQQANPALTWDELRTMEGKPVWVEGRTMEDEYKFWCIVGKTDVLDRYIHLREHGHNNWKDTYGDWWQAYRKER